MSGPQRELPPLHVKITGDSTGAVKAMQDVALAAAKANARIVRGAKKMVEKVNEATGEMVEEQVKNYREMYRRMKKLDAAYQKEREDQDKAAVARVKKLINANKKLQSLVTEGTKLQAEASKAAEKQAKEQARQQKQAEKEEQQARQAKRDKAIARNKKLDAAAKADVIAEDKRNAEKTKKQNDKIVQDTNAFLAHQKHVQDTISKIREMRAKSDQADVEASKRHTAEVQKSRDRSRRDYDKYLSDIRARNKREDDEASRVLRRSRQRTVRQLRARRDRAAAARDSLRSGIDGGSMMGARADIYMHQDTLQSMVGMTLGILQPFAQVENYTVQMEAFAGSAEKAAMVVAELQQFAVQSPYTLSGVLEASTTMMKYGAEAEHAIRMTKLLGDVAAGNTDKMRLMALAVGQAQALGRLQGQELRQMVNAGFNPLTIAAKEMAGPGASDEAIKQQMQAMQAAMRAGKLDSGIIEAALQVATSKGGDFAGLTEKQAGTLSGFATQILETIDLLKIEIVKPFADDLRALLKETKRYVDALIAWAKANPEVLKYWVKIAINVGKAIILFSALALSIAYIKWIMGSMLTVMGPLIGSMRLLTAATQLFGRRAVMAWLAATGPVALLGAALVGLGLLVNGLNHKDGFSGMFADALAAAATFGGFMWNFKDNMANIFQFIAANWRLMIMDMMSSLVPFRGSLENLMLLGGLATGQQDTVRAAIDAFKDQEKVVWGQMGYDTSMLKLGGPLSGEGAKDMLSFLNPFLKDDKPSIIPDKPNIDFRKFIGLGADTAGEIRAPREHALLGSSDHAVRMYEYGEKAKASAMSAKETHEKKTETLLTKIEQNTRAAAPAANNVTILDAGLAMGAMVK